MGNSESFDLISTSDQKNSSKKKTATHHQNSQSISSSLNKITSFDLNGIFRRLSDDISDYKVEKNVKKNKLVTPTAPPPPSPPEPHFTNKSIQQDKTEPSISEPTYSQASSDASESDYVERKLQELEYINVSEKKFVTVTLTKNDELVQEEEMKIEAVTEPKQRPEHQSNDKNEIVDEKTLSLKDTDDKLDDSEAVTSVEDDVDIINLEDKEQDPIDKDSSVDNPETEPNLELNSETAANDETYGKSKNDYADNNMEAEDETYGEHRCVI